MVMDDEGEAEEQEEEKVASPNKNEEINQKGEPRKSVTGKQKGKRKKGMEERVSIEASGASISQKTSTGRSQSNSTAVNPSQASNPPSSVPADATAVNQHWRESYADAFQSLQQRYPFQLCQYNPVDASNAERLLRGDGIPAAPSIAMVIRGAERTEEQASYDALHGALVDGLVDRDVGGTIAQQHLGSDDVYVVQDTVDAPGRRSIASYCAIDERLFISDMHLPAVDAHMQALAKRLSTASLESAASVLRGGAFEHLCSSNEFNVSAPHGVADWTLSYHFRNDARDGDSDTPLNHATGSSSVRTIAPISPAAATTSSPSPSSPSASTNVAPFPIYFHCETHRAGAVNLRLDDVQVRVLPRSQKAHIVQQTADVSRSQPAYWICVLPEEENMLLFHACMNEQAQKSSSESVQFSIDDQRTTTLSSIEPLLRAGIVLILLVQHERDLVVLQPGVPHMVLTPLQACKVSRNWITPTALLGATVRSLKGTQGERGEWFRDMCQRPLCCLLPVLQRLEVGNPREIVKLVSWADTSAQLAERWKNRASTNTPFEELLRPHTASQICLREGRIQQCYEFGESINEKVGSATASSSHV